MSTCISSCDASYVVTEWDKMDSVFKQMMMDMRYYECAKSDMSWDSKSGDDHAYDTKYNEPSYDKYYNDTKQGTRGEGKSGSGGVKGGNSTRPPNSGGK